MAALYRELADRTGSPVVQLNSAVAVAQAGEPQRALDLVDGLADRLDAYQYLHSTRGELLRRLDRPGEARAAFARALELAGDERERRLLRRRLDELDGEDLSAQ